MYKKYKFPLNLFIVFENIQPIIFTSEVLTTNHYVCVLPKYFQIGFIQFIKKELFHYQSTLLESSAIDTLEYSNILPKSSNLDLNKNRILINYSFYNYNLKLRLSLFYQYSFKSLNNLNSIDYLFKNANWLEREVSEMYNISFTNKKDTRCLLLDYSRNDYPMLKDFPCEGFDEIYYDFFDQNLNYAKNEHIVL